MPGHVVLVCLCEYENVCACACMTASPISDQTGEIRLVVSQSDDMLSQLQASSFEFMFCSQQPHDWSQQSGGKKGCSLKQHNLLLFVCLCIFLWVAVLIGLCLCISVCVCVCVCVCVRVRV